MHQTNILFLYPIDFLSAQEDNNQWTPLHYAAKGGHEQICKLILEKYENLHPAGIIVPGIVGSPLHIAAEYGHLNICKLLIGYDHQCPIGKSVS